MRDDQVSHVRNRLGDDGRGNGQAGDDPANFGQPVAEQQADVVPVGREDLWGEAVEEVADGRDGRHG
jgi:hypothetical protein